MRSILRYSFPLYAPPEAAVEAPTAITESAAEIPEPEVIEPVAAEAPADDGKPKWWLRRISQESAKAADANERAAAAERRASEAEALARRLAANKGDSPTAEPPANRQQQPVQGDRAAEVRAEAARQRFLEDVNDLRGRGHAEFGPAFGETIRILAATGADTDDFVSDALAVGRTEAHKLLATIAKDPERAVALAAMPSRQRIMELTKMTLAAAPRTETETTVAPKSVVAKSTASRAPAPAPRVESGAVTVKGDYSDDMDDAEFTALFKSRQKERSTMRR